MLSLSQEFAELTAQVHHAGKRIIDAEAEAAVRIERKHEQVREETHRALHDVQQSLGKWQRYQPSRFAILKDKIASDLRRLRLGAVKESAELQAMKASDYADHLRFEAESAIGYALAATKMAELAALEAIAAHAIAETKETEASRAEAQSGRDAGSMDASDLRQTLDV